MIVEGRGDSEAAIEVQERVRRVEGSAVREPDQTQRPRQPKSEPCFSRYVACIFSLTGRPPGFS